MELVKGASSEETNKTRCGSTLLKGVKAKNAQFNLLSQISHPLVEPSQITLSQVAVAQERLNQLLTFEGGDKQRLMLPSSKGVVMAER